jgi:hypothetical protein
VLARTVDPRASPDARLIKPCVRGFRRVAVGFACVFRAAIIGYPALKLAPDLFSWYATCLPGDKAFNECLSATKARSDDRRPVTTGTSARFAGAISILGA